MGYNGTVGRIGRVLVERHDAISGDDKGVVFLSDPELGHVKALTIAECAALGAMLTTVAEQMVAYQKGKG